MAKEHQTSQDPPTTSLSEEEISGSGESETDNESETENESETDNESESETTKSPAADSDLQKNTKRRRTKEEAITPLSERQAKENDEKKIGTETIKKSYFQRLWSEEDDLVILQGMIDFKNETGKSHTEDMHGCYESVKNSITFEGKNLHRFVNKIRTLRKKYMTKKKNGAPSSFPKPYDQKCFELSDSIWGADVESKMKKIKLKSSEPEGGMVETDWFMKSFIAGSISNLGTDKERLKQKWSLLPVETKNKVFNKWKMLEGQSVDVVVRKIEFVREVAALLF